LSTDNSIKGNPVRIRNSARYCEALEKESVLLCHCLKKDGKVAFRASQETSQAK